MPRRLAAGNWKMNGTGAALSELGALMAAHPTPRVDLLICPPVSLLHRAADRVTGHPLWLGGQDCHEAVSGAHTGDVSAEMLADAGAKAVIVGHSERRADHHETDAIVQSKASAAHRAGLKAILCVGETLAERDADKALDSVSQQITGSLPAGATADNMVIAYEPVWAIGTGHVPTAAQIEEMHTMIRARLSDLMGDAQATRMTLLYGGSVKAGNAAEIFAIPHVDGALVGGASLSAADFSPIISALEDA
ncbi:MAG: triose-phosphate isomerase [Pseudomonadota bacterium]